MPEPGTITLIGSGETSSIGGQMFEMAARPFLKGPPAGKQQPFEVSVLETPAGFEVNSQRVAGRVAEFLETRLQNYQPRVHLIAARKKGSAFSPDAPEIVRPIYGSQLIFLGPGSPTYTVRQLENSLVWQAIQTRQRLGASLVLASAAIIALGAFALPVYEIYKAGEDIHWRAGLNFFQPYGLSLAIVPHWNNHEGGDEVDTSRCFMGQERFAALRQLLPYGTTILGIDEHTALTINFAEETCFVYGVGQVHILREANQQECNAGCTFPIFDLGSYHSLADPHQGLPEEVWQNAENIQQQNEQDIPGSGPDLSPVPGAIREMVEQRQEARALKDWARADMLRKEIASLGWQVKDTPSGPEILPDE